MAENIIDKKHESFPLETHPNIDVLHLKDQNLIQGCTKAKEDTSTNSLSPITLECLKIINSNNVGLWSDSVFCENTVQEIFSEQDLSSNSDKKGSAFIPSSHEEEPQKKTFSWQKCKDLFPDKQTILNCLSLLAEEDKYCDNVLEKFVHEFKLNYLHICEEMGSPSYVVSINITEKNKLFTLRPILSSEVAFLDSIKKRFVPECIANKLVELSDAINVQILYGRYMIANIVKRLTVNSNQVCSKFLIFNAAISKVNYDDEKSLNFCCDDDSGFMNEKVESLNVNQISADEVTQAETILKEIDEAKNDDKSCTSLCMKRICFILKNILQVFKAVRYQDVEMLTKNSEHVQDNGNIEANTEDVHAFETTGDSSITETGLMFETSETSINLEACSEGSCDVQILESSSEASCDVQILGPSSKRTADQDDEYFHNPKRRRFGCVAGSCSTQQERLVCPTDDSDGETSVFPFVNSTEFLFHEILKGNVS